MRTIGDTENKMLITPELEACHPDPDYPCHIWPEDLRDRVLKGASPSEVLWEAWQRCLGDELYQALRSHSLSPAEALAKRRDDDVSNDSTEPEVLALQLTFEGLTDLAGSIVRHGLSAPIEVCDLNNGWYRIIDGERHWWAHVLLRDALLKIEAVTILARVCPSLSDKPAASIQRQAEYAQRRDLPSVARARAIEQVLQAVVAREVLGTQGARNSGGRPRQFKKATAHQLHDLVGQELRQWTDRGLCGRTVRNYLALLSLPPEVQALAEAAGLSEKALRPITSLDDPEEQVRLVYALAAGRMTPAQVATEVKCIKAIGRTHIEEKQTAKATALLQVTLCLTASDEPSDPDQMAGQIARLAPEERRKVLDLARRYASILQAILEATEGLFEEDDP